MTEADACRQLRWLLGLTQKEMARLLGVQDKTLTRLEADHPWTPSMSRLLRLMLERPVSEAGPLVARLSAIDFDAQENQADLELAKRVEGAANRLARERAVPTGSRLLDLVKELRPDTWVYWATSARAGSDETRKLADEAGVICRPLLSARPQAQKGRPTDFGYLEKIRPGDRILLCHDGEPQAWYRLHRSARPKGSKEPKHALAPVFRFIPLSSGLGKRLSTSGYRLHDGTLPVERSSGWFSALCVSREADRLVERPAPRLAGIRDTMTPFAPERS
jgi:DNA-binding XRE family transcriptional regulator